MIKTYATTKITASLFQINYHQDLHIKKRLHSLLNKLFKSFSQLCISSTFLDNKKGRDFLQFLPFSL